MNNANASEEKEIVERVIRIDRVNKVVKGGKRMSFRAFVIVGDYSAVGVSKGKSKEVPAAIKKAVAAAKRGMATVSKTKEGTLPFEVSAKYGATTVIIKPARPGRGLIAGGSVRILLELAGFKDVVAKILGSKNPSNAAKAAMVALASARIGATPSDSKKVKPVVVRG